MPNDISSTTGEGYYSGSWESIRKVLHTLDIDTGKLASVTMETVNFYQEMVDRNIDDIVGELYHVPLRSMNQTQPTGVVKRVFPGNVTKMAIYWTAGLLLLNEFQNLAQNITEQAQNYIEQSSRDAFQIVRFNHRLWGQEFKSNLSRTVPPTMQPPDLPEANF